MKKFLIRDVMLSILSILLISTVAFATPNPQTEWYWLSSNEKYSKYISKSDIFIAQKYGGVAIKINAWTKTTYTLEGAQETLKNYKINNINPSQFAYSLAEVEINPQNRILAYVQESFYNANGEVIWSKFYNPMKPKEINSQEFDEEFYTNILDYVFDQGEEDRRVADDRWLLIWSETDATGKLVAKGMADTSTMRMKGNNILFWVWEEYRNEEGNVKEIRFQKRSVNLKHHKEKISEYKRWDPVYNWKNLTNQISGLYEDIEPNSNDEKALNVLKDYAEKNSAWVNRYSIVNPYDSEVKLSAN